MQKSTKSIATFLAVVLFCLAAAETPRAATLHYAPVVSSTGDQIAFVRRQLSYSASWGSIMPFLAGEATRVTVQSDRIQLCVKNLKTGHTRVVQEWKPELVKEEGRFYIKPLLNWELENLRYTIEMRSEKDPGIGIYRCPYAYLTNLETWEGLEQGPAAAGTVRVRLSEDPGKSRFPRDNEVIVEKTWDQDRELPGIRQRLEELAARLLDAAGSEAERDRAGKLSDLIAGRRLSRLPDNLVNLFLTESANGCGNCPNLARAILLLREAAVEPLVGRYDKLPPETRPMVLSLLGQIGSGTALSLVRREIRAGNPEVQKQAVAALGKIKGVRAGEELALLLQDIGLPSPVRVTALERLREVADSNWPSVALLTALADPEIFGQLPAILPDFDLIPEQLIWKQLSAIYPYLKSDNPDAVSAAQHLVARIRFWNYLSALYPVLEDLLKARYDYGRTVDAEGNFINADPWPPDDRVVWDRDLAADMLDHIEKTYRDPGDWIGEAWKKASLLTLLYIEDLYLSRTGNRILNRPPVRVVLDVSLQDAAGTAYACDRHVAELERETRWQGGSPAAGFSALACEGHLVLDRKRWRLTFTPLTVRFGGKTLAIPVSIPFGGACRIELGPQEPSASGPCLLILKHIDQQA